MQSGSRPASTSTRPPISPIQRNGPLQLNTQTKVLDATHGRILCIADIRGRLSALNDLAREHNASAIIHTGDFGFFEASSLERIGDRTLRHLIMYSPLIPTAQRNHLLSPENPAAHIRHTVDVSMLSEFPLLLSGQIKLQVPVYTVWGACEDVSILEKFRSGIYSIENINVLDEATTRLIDVGGVKLRLLGLGGALVPHKMFDNGDGQATIAGGSGTMWTTALQIGELVDTAQRVYHPTETRLLVSHASPGREGIINQLSLVLKADLTISAGLHFRYASSYNEFSVQGDYEGYRHKLLVGKEGFDKVWESVKSQVDAVIDENQRVLLDKFLSVVERIPPSQTNAGPGGPGQAEEPAWKNCWNWNLCDAAYGSLVLDIKEGRVSGELKSQGFNYAYRRTATGASAQTPTSSVTGLPVSSTPNQPTKASTPIPPPADKSASPHLPGKSNGSTPPPVSVPRSGKETPKEPAGRDGDGLKVNGAASPASDKAVEKAEKKREKRKEKKDKDRAEREAAKDKEGGGENKEEGGKDAAAAGKSGNATPVDGLGVEERSRKGTPEADRVMSPATESGGARTPTGRRPARNPWTLFVRGSIPMPEHELREYFNEAQSTIIRVHYPASPSGRNQKIAYVEFGDEESMKNALSKRSEKFKDVEIECKQAEPREDRPMRGRGRGRGGFASRGFAQAGLMRGGGPSHSSGGDRGGNGGNA